MSYPTEQQLRTIKNWDLTKQSVSGLLDFVEPLWEYPERFIRRQHTLYLSTGGWSGNEDIIASLHYNFLFWSMYWRKSQRGGHYWFNDSRVSDELKGFRPPRISKARKAKPPVSDSGDKG